MMEKTPLAVKYRPKKLSDVIGQEVPVRTLLNSFKDDNWHHAYLLCGNLGCGKTSVARIMAAMDNNPDGKTTEPDENSSVCQSIFSGKSIDIKEMDAASNRSINDIRDIKKDAQLAPITGRVKYYIIDEVHSLTDEAAEAMLKFLEEPPSHVRILLCTTNPEMLKETIHSRCITLNFNKVGWSQIAEHLKNISIKENIKADEDALRFIAKTSKGSVRNSLQNFQSVLNFVGDEKITLEAAQKSLGFVDESFYYDLINDISKGNICDSILKINKLIARVGATETILRGFEGYLRNILLARTCDKEIGKLDFTEDETQRLISQSKILSPKVVIYMVKRLTEVQRAISYNGDLQNNLELFAIDSIVEVLKENSKK